MEVHTREGVTRDWGFQEGEAHTREGLYLREFTKRREGLSIQREQESITRSEQLPCARVTAFTRTNLFLVRFWREF